MTDTPESVRTRYAEELLRQPPARRVEMACSMFGSAKALALAGIRMQLGRGSVSDERRALLLRFYGGDLSQERLGSAAAHLPAA